MKIRKSLRVCCLALVFLLCFGIFAACDQEEAGNSSGSSSGGTSEQTVSYGEFQDQNGNYVAQTTGKTYGGATFTFLVCTVNKTYQSEIVKNDYNLPQYQTAEGDRMLSTLNDALGERVDVVEEQLDVVIEEDYVADDSRPSGAMSQRILQDSLAFTSNYQVVVPCLLTTALLSQQNIFLDLNAIPGLQMDAPWWDQSFNKEMTLDNKLFFTIGDIGLVNKSATAAITWNKSLYERNDLATKYGGTPYDFVRDGTWTLDLAYQMTCEFGVDLNNDGTINYEDLVGWEGQLDDMWSLFYGSGARIASAAGTADGYPVLTMYSERNAAVMEKIQTLVQDPTHYLSANDFFGQGGVQWPSILTQNNFIAGNALFFNGDMTFPLLLGDMEDDYGLVPVPKGDVEQDGYYSLVNPWSATCFAVPRWVPADQRDMLADVLNVMGAASKNLLAPVFLEQCLETMKSRDDDMKDMIDNYILPGRSADIGLVFQWGGLDALLHDMSQDANKGQFASVYQAKESAAQAALDETVNAFKQAEN